MSYLASHRQIIGCLALLGAGVLAIDSASAQQMRGTPQPLPLQDSGVKSVGNVDLALNEAPPDANTTAGGRVNESAQSVGVVGSQAADAGGSGMNVPSVAAPSSEVVGAIAEPPTRVVEDVALGRTSVSSIFQPNGGPFGGQILPTNLSDEMKVGNGTEDLSVSLPRVNFGLPALYSRVPFLNQGFAPEQAHLKLGPVFMRFRSLTGELLASDNVNLTEADRKAGCISVIRLGITVMAQVTEGFSLGLAGEISYLPFKGKVGLAVFDGLDAGLGSFLLGLTDGPILASQVAYKTQLDEWPLVFSDDFHVSRGSFSNGTRDDFYRFGTAVEQNSYEDRAGRYFFSAPNTTSVHGFTGNGSNRRFDTSSYDVTYLSNVLSVATARLIPGEVKIDAKAFREDIWYYGNTLGAVLPTWRDVARIEAESQRENLRFKPFMGYEVEKTSEMDNGVDQNLYLGVRGPITDQLSLYSRVSLFRSYNGDLDVLYRLALNHVAGPYTTESLSWSRELSEFHDEIIDMLEYRFNQVLGPDLNGTLYANVGRYENRFGAPNSRDEFRAGVQITYFMSPKTQMRLGGTYAESKSEPSSGRDRTWTARYDINYQPTDTLTARLLYQFQKHDSDLFGSSYYENLIYVMLTKTFL